MNNTTEAPKPTAKEPTLYKWRMHWEYSRELQQAFNVMAGVYGDRRTKRSGVLLINHINEGLDIISTPPHFTSLQAMAAYAVHPMFQADEDIQANAHTLHLFSGYTAALIFEYRSVANAHLSEKWMMSAKHIRLSPMDEVNKMLIADKLQNFRDFMRYHRHTHDRALELLTYFQNWSIALNVEDEFSRIVAEEGPQHDGVV